MDAKQEAPNGPPAVKNEIQNTPQKPTGPQMGPSGANKFNKGNLQQNKNKNFQQNKNIRGPPGGNMGGGPMGRGQPKNEVSTFSEK